MSSRYTGLAFVLALAAVAPAQIIPGVISDYALLTSQYRSPLTYEAALQKLADFYDTQVGKKLPMAFPEIGPRQHYDVWHDMWVSFSPGEAPLTVTMKRPSNNITNRVVRGWMLEFAGRLGAEIPIQYREYSYPVITEMEVYATHKDLTPIFKSMPAMKSLTSWQHLGLAVSAEPMLSVAMDHAGLHGMHHVTLLAENAAAMKQLSAALTQGMQRPCICGVYSELADIEQDVSKEVETATAGIGAHSTGMIFAPDSTLKHEQEVVRQRPEMKKRIMEANGNYDIKFRPDKPYARVTIVFIGMVGYDKETGIAGTEKILGRINVPNVRPPAPTSPPLNARIKMEPIKPGAYRIRLEGEAGAPIDNRLFWYDGKVFEEM
jgi:hypothetical protein